MRTSPRGGSDDQPGFALIELMMVVLVIAVLIAIAIPTFTGARRQADDRSVQSSVRNAFVATRIYFNAELVYTSDLDEMRAIEPAIEWTSDALDSSATSQTVRIMVFPEASNRPDTVVLAGRTKEGRCFYLKDVMGSGAGTYYTRDVQGAVTCPAPTPEEIDDPSWAASS